MIVSSFVLLKNPKIELFLSLIFSNGQPHAEQNGHFGGAGSSGHVRLGHVGHCGHECSGHCGHCGNVCTGQEGHFGQGSGHDSCSSLLLALFRVSLDTIDVVHS